MSERSQGNLDWRMYVRDMIEFGQKVISYTDGLNEESFKANGLVYDATLRNVQLIGQAAMYVPAKVRDSYPDIPWRAIIGVRNRLAHSYPDLSDSILWSIIEDAIPEMLPKLARILEPSDDSGQDAATL